MNDITITNIKDFSVVKFNDDGWKHIVDQNMFEFVVPMIDKFDTLDVMDVEQGICHNINKFVRPEGIRISHSYNSFNLDTNNMLFRIIK